jgi:hypothetical protein
MKIKVTILMKRGVARGNENKGDHHDEKNTN